MNEEQVEKDKMYRIRDTDLDMLKQFKMTPEYRKPIASWTRHERNAIHFTDKELAENIIKIVGGTLEEVLAND